MNDEILKNDQKDIEIENFIEIYSVLQNEVLGFLTDFYQNVLKDTDDFSDFICISVKESFLDNYKVVPFFSEEGLSKILPIISKHAKYQSGAIRSMTPSELAKLLSAQSGRCKTKSGSVSYGTIKGALRSGVQYNEISNILSKETKKMNSASIKAVLSSFDVQSFFKNNVGDFLSADEQETIKKIYAKAGVNENSCFTNKWNNLFSNAVSVRNNFFGHVSESVKESYTKDKCLEHISLFQNMFALLNTPETKGNADKHLEKINNKATCLSYPFLPMESLNLYGFLPKQASAILSRFKGIKCTENIVCCESKEFAESLLAEAKQNSERLSFAQIANNANLTVERIKAIFCDFYSYSPDSEINVSMDTAMKLISSYESIHEKKPETVQTNKNISKMLAGIKPAGKLESVKSGKLDTSLLHDLFECSDVIIDDSILLTKPGKDYLTNTLFEVLNERKYFGKHQELMVPRILRYQLLRGYERYKKVKEEYNRFDWRNSSQAAQDEMTERYEEAAQYRSGYITLKDVLLSANIVRTFGDVNPNLTTADSICKYIFDNPCKRITVFTCGGNDWLSQIDTDKYPLLTVCKVSSLLGNLRATMTKNSYPLLSASSDELMRRLLWMLNDSDEPDDDSEASDDNDSGANGGESVDLTIDADFPENQNTEKTDTALSEETFESKVFELPAEVEVPEAAPPKKAPESLIRSVPVIEENNNAVSINDAPKPNIQKKEPKNTITAEYIKKYNLRNNESGKLEVSHEPKIGDVLTAENGRKITLQRVMRIDGGLAKGGEGIIYEITDSNSVNIDSNNVAKIYYTNDSKWTLTANRFHKLNKMTKMKVNNPSVCWPSSLLFNEDKQFVGYLMAKVPNGWVNISNSLMLIDRPDIQNGLLKNWTRSDVLKLAVNTARLFQNLHYKNIFMGDVSPNNIMINPDKPGELRFVDCDSYQVPNYPCTVITPDYMHPLLKQRLSGGVTNPRSLFRTEEEENYSIAIVLFLIVMSVNPFQRQGFVSPEAIQSAMANKQFAFASPKTAPLDRWIFFRNLTKAVREDFLKVFEKWQKVPLTKFATDLSNCIRVIETYNQLSNELVPKTLPNFGEEDYYITAKCVKCGEPVSIKRLDHNGKPADTSKVFCEKCKNLLDFEGTIKYEELQKCYYCGKKYEVTNKDVIEHETIKKKYICPECNQMLTVPCPKCGKGVKLRKYYKDKNPYIPAICTNCSKIISLNCSMCGIDFSVPKYKYNKDKPTYMVCPECTKPIEMECTSCGAKYQTRKYLYKNNPHKYQHCPDCLTNIELTCQNCGGSFTVWKYRYVQDPGKFRYCSSCLKEKFG